MEFDQWTIGLEQGLSMPPFWFFSGSCCDSSQPHVPFFSDLPGWRKTIVDLERREKRPVLKPMWNLAICTLSRPSSPGSRFMVTTMDVQAEFHYCVGSLVFHPKFIGQYFFPDSAVWYFNREGRGLSREAEAVKEQDSFHMQSLAGPFHDELSFLIAFPW